MAGFETQGDAALLPSVAPHITMIMRKKSRLDFFPNFFRFAPETSHNPDVIRHITQGTKIEQLYNLINLY